jgi:CheY-like chemotaxis protein
MKLNILVVDDEPVARQSLTDILKLEGYIVYPPRMGKRRLNTSARTPWI